MFRVISIHYAALFSNFDPSLAAADASFLRMRHPVHLPPCQSLSPYLNLQRHY